MINLPGRYDISAEEAVRLLVGRGQHSVLLDAADLSIVSRWSWMVLAGHRGKLYAFRVTKRESAIYMHRLIAGTPAGFETDHINGDGLDNRRSNLRTATCSQNSANTWKPSRPDGGPHSSSYKGVSWDRSRGKWQSKITVSGLCRNLGRYDDETAAARAYDAAAIAAWGDFAWVNFPGGTQ